MRVSNKTVFFLTNDGQLHVRVAVSIGCDVWRWMWIYINPWRSLCSSRLPIRIFISIWIFFGCFSHVSFKTVPWRLIWKKVSAWRWEGGFLFYHLPVPLHSVSASLYLVLPGNEIDVEEDDDDGRGGVVAAHFPSFTYRHTRSFLYYFHFSFSFSFFSDPTFFFSLDSFKLLKEILKFGGACEKKRKMEYNNNKEGERKREKSHLFLGVPTRPLEAPMFGLRVCVSIVCGLDIFRHH